MSVFASLVEQLADLLQPLFGLSAAAAAIVLFTALVRLLVHPLSRAAARGQKARARLQPRIAELRRRHGRNPEKLQRALLDLHTREKVSPLAGILPSLFQLPAFFLLFSLFSNTTIGGRPNELLGHELFTAPLGGRWADALGDGGPLGGAGLVYAGLFAVVVAVAAFSYRLTKRSMAANAALTGAGAGAGSSSGSGSGTGRGAAEPVAVPGMGAVAKVMPFLSFFTLVTVAVVPLAAALYVVTSMAWGVVERAALHR
ncbi:membrane protein insertase YidC [Streptomyces sp. NBC_01635]|uniref:YidC/Oxa1 family membrane protein insertase n=1 Tax=Streptomyces sp. NBC_01635 TaxID=2975904 RepID=UPI0038677E02|nr:membrane protein insertase YidC [Streptomyces sp. NBC_01635]